jgi:Tol biopolymer transport system component
VLVRVPVDVWLRNGQVYFTAEDHQNVEPHFLWSMPAHGGKVRRIVRLPIDAYDIDLAPDAKHLVFTTTKRPRVMTIASSHVRALPVAGIGAISWSPNGRWIAWVQLSADHFGLGVIRPDGLDRRLLIPGSDPSDEIGDSFRSAVWSPNGQRILSSASTPESDGYDLWVTNPASSSPGIRRVPGQVPSAGEYFAWGRVK